MCTKIIPGFEAYRIRDDGVLETNWRWGPHYPGMPAKDQWKAMPFNENQKGYRAVNLRCAAGRARRTHIHRLLAEAFVGPPPFPRACVRHLDGNSRNNTVSNLAWGSYKDNEEDKRRHGTYDKRRTGRLTEQMRQQIKTLAGAGSTQQSLADKFGVDTSTIRRLLRGETWRG